MPTTTHPARGRPSPGIRLTRQGPWRARRLLAVGIAALAIAAGSALAIHLATRPAGRHRVVFPPAIASDCSVDVTAAVGNLLADQPDHTTVLAAPHACYRIDGTIHIQDRHDLTVDGRGAVFAADRATGVAMWSIIGGRDITLENLTARGTNGRAAYHAALEHGSNISIQGARDVTVDHVHGRGAYGDFVDIGPDTRHEHGPAGEGAVMASQVTVEDSDSEISGRNAVSCVGCDGVTITHDQFADVGYIGIGLELEATSWYDRDIRVTDNTFSHVHLAVLNGSGRGHDMTRVTFSGNVMPTAAQTCDPTVVFDHSTPRTGLTISGNTLTALGRAISIDGGSEVSVTGNHATVTTGCGPPRGLYLSAVQGARVSGNDFTGSGRGFALLAPGAANAATVICGNRVPQDPDYDRPTRCTA